MFFKIGVLNNFAIYTEIHLCWSLFFKKLQDKLFKKEIPAQVISCEYWEICKSNFLIKHIWWLLLKNPWHFRFIWKTGYCLTFLLLGFLKVFYFFVLAIEIQPCDVVLLSFRNYRYANYKQFTRWIHWRLGKDGRKVTPFCVVWPIRKNYPSENGVYTDFKQAEKDYGCTGNITVLVYNSERPKNNFMLKKLLNFRKIHYIKHNPN